LYDRIAKDSMVVNVTYVDKMRNEADAKTIDLALRRDNDETIQFLDKENLMIDVIKEE